MTRVKRAPASTNGTARPSEYTPSRSAPSPTDSVDPASTRIEASTGPMHGAAQTANAPPSRKRDPRLRAPCSNPAPSRRSGHGRRPMNARPTTTRTKPAIFSSRNWSEKTRSPRSAAPTPSSTKTVVKPRTKGTLETTTRRGVHGRHGREVAGHERQHAGREKGDESGEEGEGNAGEVHLRSRTARAPRRRGGRAPSREAAPAAAGASGSTSGRGARLRSLLRGSRREGRARRGARSRSSTALRGRPARTRR